MTKNKDSFNSIPYAPTFYPTREEFSDALAYINFLVNCHNAKQYGIIKIVPPEDFSLSTYSKLKEVFVTPRIQNLRELSVKNKSTMFSKEQKVICSQNNKKRKINWRSIVCEVCHSAGNDEKLLLCDCCDAAYHTFCLTPVLPSVPRGSWFCPPCRNSRMSGGHGFEHMNERFHLDTFAERANRFKRSYFHKPPKRVPLEEVEEEFWRLVACSPYDDDNKVVVEYGADISGISAFETTSSKEHNLNDANNSFDENNVEIEEGPYSSWNLNKLPIHRDSALRFVEGDISGMKSPWCYAGSCFSCFCWHVEDHWTYSINYNHFGEAKTWYGIPADDAVKFEKALRQEAPGFFDRFPTLMHNLNTMFDPRDAHKRGVRIWRAHQQAGEFIVTFPRAYHAGFNQGFNFAEAVNFCPADWLWMGRKCIDIYRVVGRPCVFSHIELCARMSERCDDLSIPLLRVLSKELVDIMNTIKNDFFDKAEKLGFDLKTIRIFKGITKLTDEERACYKCKTTLFELWSSCSCKKGKLSCIHHISTLCSCVVDNRRKRLEMGYSLDEWKEQYENVSETLDNYKKWLAEVKHIATLYNISARELGFPPLTNNDLLAIVKEKSTKLESNCEENDNISSCEQPPHLEMEADGNESNSIENGSGGGEIGVDEREDEEDGHTFTMNSEVDELILPDVSYLPNKFSRNDLVQYQLRAAAQLYPINDRRSLDIILEKFDSINKGVSQLLNCVPESLNAHDKIDIQDFMYLVHQMRVLPFDFEMIQHRVDSLCKEVEKAQHNVFQLESRVTKLNNSFMYGPGGRFLGPADYHAMAPFTNTLDEMQMLLTLIKRLPVKIDGMLLLEDEMRTFDWLDKVRQLLLKASQNVLMLSELDELIQAGCRLPSKDVISQYMSLLNNRLQEGMHISKQASDIINSKEKVSVDRATVVHRDANRLNITSPSIDELRSMIITARKVQQKLEQCHITLDNIDTCGKLKLNDLSSLVEEANQLPFRFKAISEFQNLLNGAHSFLQQITSLFLGSSSTGGGDFSLLKVILPRPESAILRLQQQQPCGSSQRDKKKKITLRRIVSSIVQVEDLNNVNLFKEDFIRRNGESRLRNLFQEFAQREKQAMMQLRFFNKRKSETDDADDSASASYCLCSQSYDANSDMVECELCAEWYHYKCLNMSSTATSSSEYKNNSSTIQSFLCPLCERSQRPDCDSVLALLSAQNSSHRQLNMMESIALQELLERVYNFRDRVKRLFDRQCNHSTQAWNECLRLFGIKSYLASGGGGNNNNDKKSANINSNLSNRKQTLKMSMSGALLPHASVNNEDADSCKSFPSDSKSKLKGRDRWSFKANDLKRLKYYCTLWLNDTNHNQLPEPILPEMEEFLVEGSLLEITCNEAKALSLLYQIIHSVINEANQADRDSAAMSMASYSDDDHVQQTDLNNKSKDRKSLSTVRRGGGANAMETTSTISSNKGRKPKSAPLKCTTAKSKNVNAARKRRMNSGSSKFDNDSQRMTVTEKINKIRKSGNSNYDFAPLQEEYDDDIEGGRGRSKKIPKCLASAATTTAAADIKEENDSSITSHHPLSDKKSPSSIDSDFAFEVNWRRSQSPTSVPQKNSKKNGRKRKVKSKQQSIKTDSKSSKNDSATSSSDVEEECARGPACIIHDKKRIRNVLWIQCDQCSQWYHYFCVGIRSTNQVSDEYVCPVCESTKTSSLLVDSDNVQHHSLIEQNMLLQQSNSDFLSSTT